MASTSQRSFAKGEVAPEIYPRADLAAYITGLRTMRNCFTKRQGGAAKRPGFEFICQLGNQAKRGRLIKFVFNQRQSFVLQFEDLTLRFITHGGQVMDPNNGSIAYQIASPYTESDLPDLKYVQSGDVVTFTHPNYPPYELKRFSTTDWTLTAINFLPVIGTPVLTGGVVSIGEALTGTQYIITAIAADTSEESSPSTAVTPVQSGVVLPSNAGAFRVLLNWPAVPGASSYNIYRNDTALANQGAYGLVGVATAPGFADEGFDPDTTYQPPTVKNPFVGAGNYPSVCTYYQQRLVFANSVNNPNRVWASQIGSYHNFNDHSGLAGLVAIQDDDSIQFDVVSDEVSPITNLTSLGRLIVHTEGPEWVADGDANGVLTPIAINLRPVSYNGTNNKRPLKTDDRILYVQALGGLVREISSTVNFGYYSFASRDMTAYSSHLFEGYTIDEWDWQQVPNLLAWAVRSDGSLLGLTFIPEQQMDAWHRHDTLGFFESVCVVPEGNEHFLYAIVQRYISGSYRRFVERMSTTINEPVYPSLVSIAALGNGPTGVPTPPPPAPTPPPSTNTLNPPTSPATSDVGLTSATANWTSGNLTAPTEVSIRIQGTSDQSWTVTTVAAGVQANTFTGLTQNTAYEWRVRHVLVSGATTLTSDYLGPSLDTRFTTEAQIQTLTAQANAPTFQNLIQNTGQGSTIVWGPVGDARTVLQRLQIAGPQSLTPTDGDFSDIGTFVPSILTTGYTLPSTGKYWLRVRNEAPGFTNSAWSPVSGATITVN